jgi:hypothetical protein
VRRASLGVLALAALSVALSGASAQAGTDKLAEHLRMLDPAALLGGKSIVGTNPGQELHGVHGKPNFIIALGDNETIHGASKNDQLGALGEGVKIVPSHQGHSLIVAGPHSKIVVTGKGHNLITSHAKGATIILQSPGDKVIANGPHDKIVCAAHAHHELIEVAKGEKVTKSCSGHHNTIEHLTSSSGSARSSTALAHSSATVTGDGSAERPYVADCFDPSHVDCEVRSFAPRRLNGLWANEVPPAYKCPGFVDSLGVHDHPYLLNQSYAPWGTHLDKGVEVDGLGDIGADIRTTSNISYGTGAFSVQTYNGHPSSATNWTVFPDSYQVILHCTSNPFHGY